MNKLIEEPIQKLHELSDPKQIPFMEMMVPSKQQLLGIKAPVIRKVLKQFKLDTKHLSTREQINLAIALVNEGILEAGQMAYEYIGKNNKLLESLTKNDLKLLNKNLDNWASVDTFGVYIHGQAWQIGIISTEDIVEMAKNEDLWQRRLAIVSTIPLNQKSSGGFGDHERTLKICDLVIEDHRDLIVKALSWALRKLAVVEPQIVLSYLENHKQQIHNRVHREVNNKITFGKKNI